MVDEIDNKQNDYELAGIGTAELAGIGAAESAAELISNDHNKNGEQTEETVGLLGGISLIVGTMIGSGIFASSSAVAVYAGSVGMTLAAWVGCGVLVLMASLCYVELGVAIPKSGAEYDYIMEALGEIPAFLFTFFSTIIIRPLAVAAILLSTGNYIVEPVFGLDCEPANNVLIAKVLGALFLGEITPEDNIITDVYLFQSEYLYSSFKTDYFELIAKYLKLFAEKMNGLVSI